MKQVFLRASKCVDDRTPDVLAALQSLFPGPGRINFEDGTYHFYGNSGQTAFLTPSNNCNGNQNVIFPVTDFRGIEINGGGARFIVHGQAVPFWVANSAEVTFRHFSLDWSRPFYSQSRILAVDDAGLDLELDYSLYPHEVRDGAIFFRGEDWEMPLIQGIMELDSGTGAPSFLSGDNLRSVVDPQQFEFEQVKGNRIRINYPFAYKATAGNWLLLRHYPRLSPAFFLEGSENCAFEGVSIYHSGAMGIIAQLCCNVTMKQLNVEPTPGSGRFFFSRSGCDSFR